MNIRVNNCDRFNELRRLTWSGTCQYHSTIQEQCTDEHFKEHHLFYEFFNSDTGQGLGASHQTGWMALIASLLLDG